MRLSPEYLVQILYIFSLDLETFQVDVCVCVEEKTHFYCKLLDACCSLDTHRKLIFSCEGKARQGVTKVAYHTIVTSYSLTDTQ